MTTLLYTRTYEYICICTISHVKFTTAADWDKTSGRGGGRIIHIYVFFMYFFFLPFFSFFSVPEKILGLPLFWQPLLLCLFYSCFAHVFSGILICLFSFRSLLKLFLCYFVAGKGAPIQEGWSDVISCDLEPCPNCRRICTQSFIKICKWMGSWKKNIMYPQTTYF